MAHAQLQLIYEKYKQLVRLHELQVEAHFVAPLLKPTDDEIIEVRKVCPHSFVLKIIDGLKIN